MTNSQTCCPSKLRLDQYRFAELKDDERTAIKSHLVDCDRCTAYLANANTTEEALVAQCDEVRFANNVLERLTPADKKEEEKRPSFLQQLQLRVNLGWLAAATTAACFSLWLGFSMLDQGPIDLDQQDIRIKGASSLKIYLKRQGKVRVVKQQQSILPEDAIRFELLSQKLNHVIVISLQQNGGVTVYAPFDGSQSQKILLGKAVTLPGSIILDGKQDELIVALLSDKPILAKQVRLAAEKSWRAAKGNLSAITRLPLPYLQHLKRLPAKRGANQ